MGDEEIGPKDKVIQLRNQKRGGWSPQGGSREEYLANGEIGTVARYKTKGGWFDVSIRKSGDGVSRLRGRVCGDTLSWGA